jgi:hypothetical protein
MRIMRALNISDGAGVSSPGVKDLLPSTRFTKETEGKEILGLASGAVFVPERFNRGDCTCI